VHGVWRGPLPLPVDGWPASEREPGDPPGVPEVTLGEAPDDPPVFDQPLIEMAQDWFEGMKPLPWGCFDCQKQVVAEWTKDEEFIFHCGCSFAMPRRHGKLEPK